MKPFFKGNFLKFLKKKISGEENFFWETISSKENSGERKEFSGEKKILARTKILVKKKLWWKQIQLNKFW